MSWPPSAQQGCPNSRTGARMPRSLPYGSVDLLRATSLRRTDLASGNNISIVLVPRLCPTRGMSTCCESAVHARRHRWAPLRMSLRTALSARSCTMWHLIVIYDHKTLPYARGFNRRRKCPACPQQLNLAAELAEACLGLVSSPYGDTSPSMHASIDAQDL